MALQFEWAWQHCDKSLAVRAALGGDTEARILKRKRGIEGQLTILKTLLVQCPDLYERNLLTLFFLERKYLDMYEKISVQERKSTAGASGEFSPLSLISQQRIRSLEEMPFWRSRNQRAPSKKQSQSLETEDAQQVNELGSLYRRCQDCDFLLDSSSDDDEDSDESVGSDGIHSLAHPISNDFDFMSSSDDDLEDVTPSDKPNKHLLEESLSNTEGGLLDDEDSLSVLTSTMSALRMVPTAKPGTAFGDAGSLSSHSNFGDSLDEENDFSGTGSRAPPESSAGGESEETLTRMTDAKTKPLQIPETPPAESERQEAVILTESDDDSDERSDDFAVIRAKPYTQSTSPVHKSEVIDLCSP